jgi:hypothetical protein
MKQMILTLAVALSSVFAFAGEENANVDAQVLNAFKSEFVTAKDVKWTTSSTYYKASFVFNSQYVSAFYSLDGELMGLTRNITSLELPVKLQSGLRKSYSKYWISELFETSNNDGTRYYVTLENADQKIILKSTGNNTWEVFKKITKA